MSDAISHAVLPGIVIMFLLVKRLDSPLLLYGASLAGLLIVAVTQYVINSGKIRKEVAIGLIFPFFFSLGVILICRYARDVHLDTDMVLLGDIVFTPFRLLSFNGIVLGPYALWLMAGLIVCNALFVTIFYKELLTATFDQDYAQLMGLRPTVIHCVLMGLTSITAVAAFDLVGSIVVVALMVVPAATSLLCTDRIQVALILALCFGVLSGVGGYAFAHMYDISISGSVALMAGFLFLLLFIIAPKRGMRAMWIFKSRSAKKMAIRALRLFLDKTDLNGYQFPTESLVYRASKELGWTVSYTSTVMQWAWQKGGNHR